MPGALPCSAHQPSERGLQVASLTRGRMTGREMQKSWHLRESGRGQPFVFCHDTSLINPLTASPSLEQ